MRASTFRCRSTWAASAPSSAAARQRAVKSASAVSPRPADQLQGLVAEDPGGAGAVQVVDQGLLGGSEVGLACRAGPSVDHVGSAGRRLGRAGRGRRGRRRRAAAGSTVVAEREQHGLPLLACRAGRGRRRRRAARRGRRGRERGPNRPGPSPTWAVHGAAGSSQRTGTPSATGGATGVASPVDAGAAPAVGTSVASGCAGATVGASVSAARRSAISVEICSRVSGPRRYDMAHRVVNSDGASTLAAAAARTRACRARR